MRKFPNWRPLLFMLSLIFLTGFREDVSQLHVNSKHTNVTSDNTAAEIAEIMSNILIDMNNLNKEEYCLYSTTLSNYSLSTQDKLDALESMPNCLQVATNMGTYVTKLNNLNASNFLNNPVNMATWLNEFEADLDIQNSPCAAFNAARASCQSSFAVCVAGAGLGCSFSGPAYFLCAATALGVCGWDMNTCINVACIGNSGCGPCAPGSIYGGGTGFIPNPWFGFWGPASSGSGSFTNPCEPQ